MFWAWRPDRPNGTWVAKPCLTEWGHQIHIWDFSAGGYTLTLSCWGDSQRSVESVSIYVFIKKPTASVITAASLLMRLLLFQLTNMDTDGIKQNVTQTSLQPPGLLNLNVWLLVGPGISQGSFTEKSLSSHVRPKSVLSKQQTIIVRVRYYYYSVRISIRIIHPTGTYCRSENIFPSFAAAVATSSLPGSIIQQRRHLPLEMI